MPRHVVNSLIETKQKQLLPLQMHSMKLDFPNFDGNDAL